jgi:hypothetical protein
LFDKREAGIAGGCHRKSYFRMTGEPPSNQIDIVAARRFRTGRAMELDIVNLAKAAGIFVAAGVRYHVADIDLPLELDLVVRDPQTARMYIIENKTTYGYAANKEVIKDGHPRLEGVMQSTIYLNGFSTGEILKEIIHESCRRKQAARDEMQVWDHDQASWQFQKAKKEFERNRIEVDFDAMELCSDGPVGVKMTYETRDDCQTREFEIGLLGDELDGLHYPMIDGIPQKLFTVESVYERFRALQGYHFRNIGFVRRELAIAGTLEPGKGLGQDGKDRTGFEQSRADMSYWDLVFQNVRALPSNFWPPAEYEWKYSAEKIQTLGEAGIIGKTKYRNWQKRAKGKTHLGAWQCAHCPFKTKCVSVEYPEMRHQVADLMLDDGNIEPLATRLREICRCTCRRSRSGAGGSKRGRILRHQCREDALSRIPRKGIVRRLRRGRSGLQVRHRLAAEASRHVLDCPWRQRHHRPALLPHQREVRGLLGTGSGGMINPSSHF